MLENYACTSGEQINIDSESEPELEKVRDSLGSEFQ